jgi:hypothetical protein
MRLGARTAWLALCLVACHASDDDNPTMGTPGTPVFPAPGVIPPERPPRSDHVISDENAKPGDPSWQIDLAAPNHEVEGYGDRISLRAGDTVGVKVNVSTPQTVTWAVYRTGWYGGAGGRRMGEGGPVAVTPQPACPRDKTTSLVACSWSTSFSWTVPMDAVSGVYLVKLTGSSHYQAWVPFVVYDGRTADIVANVNVSSWQAYNDYGGESLYSDSSGTMPSGKAWMVSFDRPFTEGHGAGRFPAWEQSLFHWLEALGYDVSYTTALDITHDPFHVTSARMFLSVGNDEYWTVAERNAVENARNLGVNLAFLGADQALWRVRLQPSATGAPDRIVVGYKSDQAQDPVAVADPSQSTARFRDDPNPRPENAIIGVMYNSWLLTPQPMVVADASSWVFAGTGLSNGDSLPMVVGVETDDRYANGVEPPGLQVLASSPIADAEGGPLRSTAVTYRHPSGAEVVGMGSIGWATGLAEYADPRVARITRNIVDRLVGAGRKGDPDPMGAPWTQTALAQVVDGAWAKSVVTIAGAPTTGMNPLPVDGPGASARFVGPDGVAVAPDGTVYVADAYTDQIRRIANDAQHTVSTYAGDGIDGTTNGPGASARFRYPAGLAVRADGTVFVADADNHVVRAIAPDAAHTVTTYAGLFTRTGGFAEGPGATAQFNRPAALAVDAAGNVFVADMHNCRVRKIAPDAAHTVSTYAGSSIGFADGPAATAQFNNLSAIALAPDGTMYVLDTFSRAIRRIGIDAQHTVTTLTGGDPLLVGQVDGPGSSSRMGPQAGLALIGNRLFVSDISSQRIRVVTPGANAASTLVQTFAGSGRVALEDGAGSTAALATPMGLGVGPDNSLWVADSGNAAIRRILP